MPSDLVTITLLPVGESRDYGASLCSHLFERLHSPNDLRNKGKPVLVIDLDEYGCTGISDCIKVSSSCSCDRSDGFYIYVSLQSYSTHLEKSHSLDKLLLGGCTLKVNTSDLRIEYALVHSLSYIYLDSIFQEHDIFTLRSFLTNKIVFGGKKNILLDHHLEYNSIIVDTTNFGDGKFYRIELETNILWNDVKKEYDNELDYTKKLTTSEFPSEIIDSQTIELQKLIALSIQWYESFPGVLFQPPCGVLLKSSNSSDALQ